MAAQEEADTTARELDEAACSEAATWPSQASIDAFGAHDGGATALHHAVSTAAVSCALVDSGGGLVAVAIFQDAAPSGVDTDAVASAVESVLDGATVRVRSTQ